MRIVVAVRCVAAQPTQNALFRVCVHAGQRVVKNQNRRPPQQSAGNCGALLLPAGEGYAAFAHHGFKALRKLLELAADVRGFGGIQHLLGLGVRERRRPGFSRIVSLNRNVSCGTMPMLRRSTASGYSRIGRPSMSSEPSGAS